ncbi:hypothetical protein [Lysinibacillus sphaericus]|uniref:hypothetical protein n=1 Tax=Lysinibacillus sphaericus TaxID=1421 RepID=UPI003D7F47A9
MSYYYPNYNSYYYYGVPPSTIMDELAANRRNHCYRSHWIGRDHIFNLSGFDTVSGIVDVLEYGDPVKVHHSDMVGLIYLGPNCYTSPSLPKPPPGYEDCALIPLSDGGYMVDCSRRRR